jgi:phosphatidylglycerol---prolipoprotein diacylglyceryl transferase
VLPVLARIAPVTVYTHDVFTLLGLLVGMALYYRALRRDHLLEPRIAIISIAALTGGVVGAHLLTSWEVLGAVSAAGMPVTAVLTDGPKSILGGFVGGHVAIVLAKRALGYTLSTGDCYAAALPLGLAIGRIDPPQPVHPSPPAPDQGLLGGRRSR